MNIWSIADLHLSFSTDKPMEVFGERWSEHPVKIKIAWENKIKPEDLVVIPGDISWGMSLLEARADLEWLASLPGTKLIIKGNHDYWWSSISKVRQNLPPGIFALQNDHFNWGAWSVCGTRGWICPGEPRFDENEDHKIYLREVIRLELSLKSAYNNGGRTLLVALHYPPFNANQDPSEFTRLLKEYGVKKCLYGHLHGAALEQAFEGEMDGIEYRLVAADGLDFNPALIVNQSGV